MVEIDETKKIVSKVINHGLLLKDESLETQFYPRCGFKSNLELGRLPDRKRRI